MKYDLEVSLADANTSHAQVVELVGSGNRVLDVGCSTGGLAQVLRARGNTVSGVEIDPDAAKAAEPYLEHIVVGDLETMDLRDHFPDGSFDVIVFADVLEHLRDPVTVLHDALPLLAPGGAVVVSLPNVAHGSVRLSLLEGRFEYRPLGLLDDTHLRFFTRSGVEQLLDSAGLIPVDMRRTTADAFATEIPLLPENFTDDVVERVRSYPDSDTYQFVLRAIPVEGANGDDLAPQLVARNEELQALRMQVRDILGAARGYLPPHTVGLFADVDEGPGGPWSSLRTAIVSQELHRRLEGGSLIHLRPRRDSPPANWRGDPVVAIDPSSESTAELLADAYDAIVLAAGEVPAETGQLLSSLRERGCPVIAGGIAASLRGAIADKVRSGSVRTASGARSVLAGLSAVPDPLVLADRVVGGNDLALRRQYLRAARGLSVDGGYVLVAVGCVPADQLGSLGRAIHELAATGPYRVVIVPVPPAGATSTQASDLAEHVSASLVGRPTEVDLLALVAGAELVVTDAAVCTATGIALKRPVLAFGSDPELTDLASWSGDPDLVAATPAELVGRVGLARQRSGDDHMLARLRAPLDLAFDEMASAVTGAAARRVSLSIGEVLTLLQSRVASLEQANMAMQTRLVLERNALGARATQIWASEHGSGGAAAQRLEEARIRAEERAAEAERETETVRAELQAIMATKTMRVLSPGRKLYGRLRHMAK